jgi:hypothetical protein
MTYCRYMVTEMKMGLLLLCCIMFMYTGATSVRGPCLCTPVCPLPRRVCPQLPQFDDRRSDIVKQIVHVRLEYILCMCVEPLCLGMLCACWDDASACCFLFSCIPSWGDTEGAISAMCVCVRVHTRTPSFAVALHRILSLL